MFGRVTITLGIGHISSYSLSLHTVNILLGMGSQTALLLEMDNLHLDLTIAKYATSFDCFACFYQ